MRSFYQMLVWNINQDQLNYLQCQVVSIRYYSISRYKQNQTRSQENTLGNNVSKTSRAGEKYDGIMHLERSFCSLN